MASNADNYAASLDPRMQASITAAIYAYAQQIYGTGDAGDKAFATKVVSGIVNLQPLIASACSYASLTALSTAPSSDTTINATVATLWPMWAAG